MTSLHLHTGTDAGPVMRSGSPWLAMLRMCLVYCGVVVVPLCIVAGFVSGWPGLGSSLFGAFVVIAFSSITLLIGHRAGPDKPMQAFGLFVVAYAAKILGFGALLLVPGRPSWLEGGWFFAAALASVLAWQVAELRVFARSRLLLYTDDDDEAAPPTRPSAEDEPTGTYSAVTHSAEIDSAEIKEGRR